MKEFIKSSNGCLVPTDQAKVKVYDSIQAAQTALDNGELSENEVFATRFTDNGEDMALEINAMADDIATLNSYVPAGTDGDTNLLVNQCQLTCAMGDAKVDVYCGSTCVCTVSAAAPLNLAANAFNEYAQIDLTTYPGACCLGTPIDVYCGNTCVCTLDTNANCLCLNAAAFDGVDLTNIESDITNLQSCPGLNCIGNVTKSMFSLDGNGNLTITW